MGLFNQQIFIPRTLYIWLPLLYFLAGVVFWFAFDHVLAKLLALVLVGFAAFISLKRFSSSGEGQKTRRRGS